jgi:hypothetical protein
MRLRRGQKIAASLVAAFLFSAACSFDTNDRAPYVGPPVAQGECGTTETLFPKLLAFVRNDEFAPLRDVLEMRLLPTPDNPTPDVSLRTVIGDLVRLVSELGLDRTQLVVDFVQKQSFESQVSPLLSTVLKFMDGRLDGMSHYEAGDAAAVFLRRCDPDHLLLAVEGVLRLKSPSHNDVPWLFALLQDAEPLISDPKLLPFLDTFQAQAKSGRPAIIAILVQIMVAVANVDFSIDHVETILESAVYGTNLGTSLRPEIDPLVRLLGEATSKDAGILQPLQQAVECGLEHPTERDELLGLVYDLVATSEVGLDTVIKAVNAVLEPTLAADELNLFADVLKVIRTDLTIRDDLRETIAILLSSPDTKLTVPVLIELIDQGVLSELFEALAKLLSGCGRT